MNMKPSDQEDDRLSQSSHESDLNKFPVGLTNDPSEQEPGGEKDKATNDISSVNGDLQGGSASRNHVSGLSDGLLASATADAESLSLHSQPETYDEVKSRSRPSKCSACRGRCWSGCLACCRPCLTEYHPLPRSPSRHQRAKYAVMCPPHGPLARALTSLLVLLFFWGTMWGITGPAALPGGNIFAIIVLFVASSLGGALVAKIKLPALLGMLIMGCLLRNVPYINVAKDIQPAWSATLRNIALVVILTRAGLGLDPIALRKLSLGVIRLAFMPCLVETVTAAVTSHLLLGFPWIWGFMLGFVLSAVSPAVVVPSMLALTEKGYGVDKGIPTLIIAAASVDDVLAISGFGVVLGIAFSKGNLALTIVKGPLEAVLGVLYGVVFGILVWFLPHKKHSSLTLFRFLTLFCAGLLALFGSRRADLSGAGALACLTMPFVAALLWRKDAPPGKEMPVSGIFAALWVVFQPLLFGLIGAEVDIMEIQPKTIGMGVAVLVIGLAIRMVVSFLAVFGLGLTLKEKFFIPFAWLPKATVQAAIGSFALDTARDMYPEDDPKVELGKQVLTIAVLVILITAPLGAIAIALSAPRLLTKTPKAIDQIEVGRDENGEMTTQEAKGLTDMDGAEGETEHVKESIML